MKEMRLFEVGFKEEPTSISYYNKVNVGASDAGTAIDKARSHVSEETVRWWESGGREDNIFCAYADDAKRSSMSDAEVLASEKYQKIAQKEFSAEMERVKNLYLAKVLDIGMLIV